MKTINLTEALASINRSPEYPLEQWIGESSIGPTYVSEFKIELNDKKLNSYIVVFLGVEFESFYKILTIDDKGYVSESLKVYIYLFDSLQKDKIREYINRVIVPALGIEDKIEKELINDIVSNYIISNVKKYEGSIEDV